jgi:hypothetical protein
MVQNKDWTCGLNMKHQIIINSVVTVEIENTETIFTSIYCSEQSQSYVSHLILCILVCYELSYRNIDLTSVKIRKQYSVFL